MKVLLYTNILTPYRKYFFDKLYAQCLSDGHNFEVAVMSNTEPNRNWNYEQFQSEYTHLLKCKTFSYKEIFIHFNPDLKDYLLSLQPDVVICAGGYLSPGIYTVLALKKKLGYKVIFWSESHLNEVRNYSKIKLWTRERIRKTIYGKFDGFFYAGKLSLEFIDKYASNSAKCFLPNLIDEQKYKLSFYMDTTQKNDIVKKYNLDMYKKIFICPARLSPVKGLVEFIDIFRHCEYKDRVTILVAGEGELEEKILNLSKQENLDIRLLGYKSQSEMVELYAVADFFLLPSLSDPNPLTCIEALWAGLPLMVTNHVGNYPEVVEEGVNGYIIDYSLFDDALSKMCELITSSDDWIKSARSKSCLIAQSKYSSKQVIKRIVNYLNEI